MNAKEIEEFYLTLEKLCRRIKPTLVARMLGVHPPQVYAWRKRQRKPSKKSIEKLRNIARKIEDLS